MFYKHQLLLDLRLFGSKYLFPLHISVCEELRLLIMALSGLYSYLFFQTWHLFCHYLLFLIFPSFVSVEGCASLTLSFPGYLDIFFQDPGINIFYRH